MARIGVHTVEIVILLGDNENGEPIMARTASTKAE